MTLKELSSITELNYSTLIKWNSLDPSNPKKKLLTLLRDTDKSVLLRYFKKGEQDAETNK